MRKITFMRMLSTILSITLMTCMFFSFSSGISYKKVLAAADPQPVYPGSDQWLLTFSDEFNGTEVDTTKWTIRDTDQYSYHDKSYVSESNGNLNLKIDKDPITGKVMLGRIDTHGYDQTVNNVKWDQKYGYFECRTDVPPTEQTYFAFWMQNYPGMKNVDGTGHDGAEIDVTETAIAADQTMTTIHWDGYGSSHVQAGIKGVDAPNLHNGFHTYGMEWDPDTLKFYFDGKLTWTYSGVGVPWVKEIIILSSGSASWNEGNIQNAQLPVYCNVDYVRVWSKMPSNSNTVSIVSNGDFESGNKSPWTSYLDSGISDTNSYAGSYCGYVNPAASINQHITGLTPNTTYSYSAWIRTEGSSESAYLGVKNFGGTEIKELITSDSYQKYTITFTTGETDTSADIYFEKPDTGGTGKAYIDLVEVSPIDKSGLASGITQAQALNKDDYTADSWSALQTNLQAAIAVNENKTATQNEVFTAINNLNTALSNLGAVAKGVQINKTSSVLEVGEPDTLFARVTPDNAANKKITFTKDGTAVSVSDAVYNLDGTTSVSIKALAVGTATITATAEDGGWSATYTVDVVERTNNLAYNRGFESGTVSPWTIYKVAGVSNTNAYAGTYCGYVTPSASLDQLITGLKPNTTYSYSAWACVEKSGESVQVGVKNFNGTQQVIKQVTSTGYQKYTVIFTTGATNTKANIWFWKSSTAGTGKAYIDSVVVTPIDKSGLASGIAQAQALNQDDYTADSWSALQTDLQAAITVNASKTANQDEIDNVLKNLRTSMNNLVVKVKGLQLNKTSNTLTVGGTDTLIAMVIPNNATNKEVVFTKDGNAVSVSDAVYNADGTTSVTITAIEVGTATITATEVGSGCTAQYQVTVSNAIPTTLTGPDSVGIGEQLNLKYGLVEVQNISAQDITVSYDKNLFDFVSAESVKNGTVIQETYNNAEAGKVRFIVISFGAENAINGTIDIMNIKFNSKTSGTGNISVTNASLSNGQGEMTYAATSNKSITVDTDKAALIAAINAVQVIYNNAEEGLAIGQYPAETKARLNIAIVNAAAVRDNMATTAQVAQAITDLNTALNTFKNLVITSSTGDIYVDGVIDVSDLGIVAYNYGKKAGDQDWDTIKKSDINGDGEIELYDLAFIAKKILGN